MTGEALCDKLSKVLEDFGPEKIVLCISDSAANCKLAGQLLEERFPHITWLPCATHICDLALKVRMQVLHLSFQMPFEMHMQMPQPMLHAPSVQSSCASNPIVCFLER